MFEHIWSVLCARSVIDAETNNVSIQDVVEQINIDAEPTENGFLPMQLELISLWGRKNANESVTGTERVTLIPPSGKTLLISESKIDLTKVERHRQRVRMPGLPISESGRYYFKIEVKEDNNEYHEAAAIPLTILFQPQESTNSTS